MGLSSDKKLTLYRLCLKLVDVLRPQRLRAGFGMLVIYGEGLFIDLMYDTC